MSFPLIRTVSVDDAGAIAAIYNHYVLHTAVTFETDPVSQQEMAGRIGQAAEAGLPWLVTELSGLIVGYAYASKWRVRHAYRFSVESTVYLDAGSTGKGLGFSLYQALIEAIRGCSMHCVIGGIALPNEASVRLHERLGFKKVAQFEQVGYKQNRWVDVGYWQLLLT